MAAAPSDGRLHPGKRLYEKMAGLDGKGRMECFITTVEQSLLSYKKSSFAPKEGDVFIVTFSKCGTTWTQQITKLIRNHGQEDGVDVDGAFPWLDVMSREEADALPSPRNFKSHVAYKLIPGGEPHTTAAKYISVYRNPKDVVVSAFHHFGNLFCPEKSWDKFFEDFMSGKFEGPSGNCLDFFLDWWKHKDCENILVLSYEWMKANHRAAVETIARFIGVDLTPLEVSSVVEQTTFEAMKTNPVANMNWAGALYHDRSTPFLRKGKVGDWRNFFTDEQSARMDEEIKKKLDGTGLEFVYS